MPVCHVIFIEIYKIQKQCKRRGFNTIITGIKINAKRGEILNAHMCESRFSKGISPYFSKLFKRWILYIVNKFVLYLFHVKKMQLHFCQISRKNQFFVLLHSTHNKGRWNKVIQIQYKIIQNVDPSASIGVVNDPYREKKTL